MPSRFPSFYARGRCFAPIRPGSASRERAARAEGPSFASLTSQKAGKKRRLAAPGLRSLCDNSEGLGNSTSIVPPGLDFISSSGMYSRHSAAPARWQPAACRAKYSRASGASILHACACPRPRAEFRDWSTMKREVPKGRFSLHQARSRCYAGRPSILPRNCAYDDVRADSGYMFPFC